MEWGNCKLKRELILSVCLNVTDKVDIDGHDYVVTESYKNPYLADTFTHEVTLESYRNLKILVYKDESVYDTLMQIANILDINEDTMVEKFIGWLKILELKRIYFYLC